MYLLVTKRAARLCTYSTAWMLRAEAVSHTVAAYSTLGRTNVGIYVDVSLEEGSGGVNLFSPRCQRVRSMLDDHRW